MCPDCSMAPCACRYLRSLQPGGDNADLSPVVMQMMGEPQPHRGACPCPECWSARAATWGDLWVEERSGQR